MAAAMDHVITGTPRAAHRDRDAAPDSARVVATDVLEPGQRLRHRQARRLRLVARAHAAGAARSGRRRACSPRAPRAGSGSLAEQRAYLDDFWATRRRRARGRPRAAAGGAVRAVPGPLGRRARRGARHPRQGADRHRLRRPLVLGHRPLRPAGADLHRARRRPRTRCAGATRRCRRRRSARARPRPRGRRVSVAHHPRRGVLGLLARRHRRLPRQRRHRRRRSSATCARPATTPSSATSASRSSSRPRGCGARSATTTSRAASASTASPAPTSTAPSPTTTSTRT